MHDLGGKVVYPKLNQSVTLSIRVQPPFLGLLKESSKN